MMELMRLLKDAAITGLALDSRLVKAGDLFFALPGAHFDGNQFIDEAIQNGARAILTEAPQMTVKWRDEVMLIGVPHLKSKVGVIAAEFYKHPAKQMQMIGVTGTSGKTSCTQFIAFALQRLGIPCGVVGTLGNGLYGHLESSQMTTPDAVLLQETLAALLTQGAKAVAMEVSSHSLDQGRVNGIEFAVGVFTNLTRDHLDYHGTMAAYGEAKKRLFDQSRFAVINADDEFGREMLQSFAGREHVFAYGTQAFPNCSMVLADKIKLTHAGLSATITSPWGHAQLRAPLVGQFNLSNLLAVLTTLCLSDVPLEQAVDCLAHVEAVPGRMQALGGGELPLVVVDYAHKPDALEKVLAALRQDCQGKLYCVFGCGGERDRGKRPMMAQIAERYADKVIVTDDNPRHEDPKQIVADIMQGFSNTERVTVQHDRSKAIHDVIHYAVPGDCVLIAGKGAETYQLIGDQRIPFNDVDEVLKAGIVLGMHVKFKSSSL